MIAVLRAGNIIRKVQTIPTYLLEPSNTMIGSIMERARATGAVNTILGAGTTMN
jgi:hypothetical protein